MNTLSILACGNSHRYKAVRPPTCNNGHPCRRCVAKWDQAQREKAPLPNRSRIQRVPMTVCRG
jgi:hypothetical protein